MEATIKCRVKWHVLFDGLLEAGNAMLEMPASGRLFTSFQADRLSRLADQIREAIRESGTTVTSKKG